VYTFDVSLEPAAELYPGPPGDRLHPGNDTETVPKREVNRTYENSPSMSAHGIEVKDRPARLILRCECGASITASRKSRLVELARIHFGEFHPDLGAGVPADLILAMAEEKEGATT
jgi:hypothetical protein